MNENWGAEPLRRPTIREDEMLVYSEHGRVLDNTCYRSHWFCVTKPQYGQFQLLVKHGGGEERFSIGYSRRVISSLESLDSDSRYLLLHTMYRIRSEAKQVASAATETRYKQAFADGRLKKRKLRGKSAVKVWIETNPFSAQVTI